MFYREIDKNGRVQSMELKIHSKHGTALVMPMGNVSSTMLRRRGAALVMPMGNVSSTMLRRRHLAGASTLAALFAIHTC